MQFARRATPDEIRLVRLEAVQGELVLLGVYRDRLDAKLRRRAKHAYRDFAPVGDEEPLYRRIGGSAWGHRGHSISCERFHPIGGILRKPVWGKGVAFYDAI